MTMGLYVVRRGDTLTKIAKAHGTTPQEIAALNHLTNLDLIRVGQKLFVPSAARPKVQAPTPPSASVPGETGELWFKFVDAVNKPIAGLKVFVADLEKEFEHLTDEKGTIPAVPVRHHGTPVAVSVEKAGGGRKEIAKFNSRSGVHSVLVASPKVKIRSVLQPHDGIPPQSTPLPAMPGTAICTRSAAGHPVEQVALECPNKDNLRLGPNAKYRDILLCASTRSGFPPQAIAALLDAEAAPVVRHIAKEVRDKNGNPILDPRTGVSKVRTRKEITNEWDAHSKNKYSSARGVSQVLDETWIELALTRGTFLNARARKEGWLETVPVNKNFGLKMRSTVWAFKLAEGTLVTKKPLNKTLAARPYLRTLATANDINLQELLNLRFDVECAIHTAVDYGSINMRSLSSKGYCIANLNDGEKAKIMYLCHHLGSGDACKFIDDTMTNERAQHLLKIQLGSSEAAERKAIDAGGDYLKAHRTWLSEFIDSKIKIRNHMCDPSAVPIVRKIIPITESIRRMMR